MPSAPPSSRSAAASSSTGAFSSTAYPSRARLRRQVQPKRYSICRPDREASPDLEIPGFKKKKEFFSLELVRTLADCAGPVTSFDWSSELEHLLAGSKDLMVRLFCLDKSKEAGKPFLFLGHGEPIVCAFLCTEKEGGVAISVHSILRDGAIFTWNLVRSLDFNQPLSSGTPEQMQSSDGLENFGRTRKDLDGESETSLNKVKRELVKKDFFMQAPARLTACDYHNELDMVVVTFQMGFFGCIRCLILCVFICFRYRGRRLRLPFLMGFGIV